MGLLTVFPNYGASLIVLELSAIILHIKQGRNSKFNFFYQSLTAFWWTELIQQKLPLHRIVQTLQNVVYKEKRGVSSLPNNTVWCKKKLKKKQKRIIEGWKFDEKRDI